MAKLRLGTKNGYNVNNIYTEDDEGIATVFGLPLHTKLDEIDPVRYHDALELARLIVRAVNSHESLLEALREVLDGIGALSNPTELCGWAITEERAREIVAMAMEVE